MAGRPCKICKLKKSHPEAYRLITEEISKPKGEPKIKSLLNDLETRFNLNINTQNVHRHKGHSIKKTKEPDKEMKVYSKEGELVYTNVQEIIGSLSKKERLFCEEYIVDFNSSKAYKAISSDITEASAYELGSRMLRKVGIRQYIDYLVMDREQELQVDRSFVIEKLKINLERALAEEPVKNRDGEETGFWIYNGPVVNKSLEMLGKHLGMWDKKVETKDNQEIYQGIIEKLLLNQINPITAGLEMGKHNLPVPDALKIAMNKVDPSVLDKPPLLDSEDMSEYTDEELEMIASGDNS